jgi:glucokinase-like ROK family protein
MFASEVRDAHAQGDGSGASTNASFVRRVSLPAEERLSGLVAVLEFVRTHGSSTRPKVVHATGLSRAVVTQRVAELVDSGLLVEGGLGQSTGGRAPRTVHFRADAGHLLVADLGATSVDVAVADLSGSILARVAEPCDISLGPEAVLARVDELFGRCLAGAAERRSGELWGIGIGLPGPVEFESGRPIAPPIMPGWDRYAVRERLASYGVPVWVDNDVNVMALGELRAGVARGRDNVVFVKIGTGVGAGIIVSGRLHRGAQGCAGDVGHIQIDDDPASICRCGNVGCLEAFAGGAALGRDATIAAREGRSGFLASMLADREHLTAADVAHAASHGDALSVELLTRAGRLVGRMLAGVVNFFNPSQVVIGGGVTGAGDLLLATIRETVYRRSLPLATRDLVVQRSTLGELAGVTGAAAMVADELFAPRRLASVLERGAGAAAAEYAAAR